MNDYRVDSATRVVFLGIWAVAVAVVALTVTRYFHGRRGRTSDCRSFAVEVLLAGFALVVAGSLLGPVLAIWFGDMGIYAGLMVGFIGIGLVVGYRRPIRSSHGVRKI